MPKHVKFSHAYTARIQSYQNIMPVHKSEALWIHGNHKIIMVGMHHDDNGFLVMRLIVIGYPQIKVGIG